MIILREKRYNTINDNNFESGGMTDMLNLMRKKLNLKNRTKNLVINIGKKIDNANRYLRTTPPEDIISDGVQKLVEAPIATVGTAAGYGTMATGLYVPATTPASVALDAGTRKLIPGYDKLTKRWGKNYRERGNEVVKAAITGVKNSLGGITA